MRFSLALSALASLALAQTDEQKYEYSQFTAAIGIYNYTWEPIDVHTDDGYTLTMFHVTGKNSLDDQGNETTVQIESTNGPILIQPSMGLESFDWIMDYFYTDPER